MPRILKLEFPAQVGANFREGSSFHVGARLLSDTGVSQGSLETPASLPGLWCCSTGRSPLPPARLRTFHKLSSQYSTLLGPITNPSPSHSLLLVVSSRKSSVRPAPVESIPSKDPGTLSGRDHPIAPDSLRQGWKKGFQPSELWLLSEKERRKERKNKKQLTNLFAVGAEVSGGDGSFVTFKRTFQNRILLGWKVVRFESRCRIPALGIRRQRCLFLGTEEEDPRSIRGEAREARASQPG